MPIAHPFFLFIAAFLAGTLNSVAGGGSFISFPALLFAGVPPINANATSTAAVWPGTVASTIAYRRELTADSRRLLGPLLVTGIFGGIVGARILLLTPQQTFLRMVPWLLLGATLIFVFSGRISRKLNDLLRSRSVRAASDSRRPRPLLVLGLFLEFLISIYIGYFGAGVGILVLTLLALLGMENIHAMNAVKSILVGVVNGVALITFIAARVIYWPQAVLMIAGAVVGGYGGAYFARRMKPAHVRAIVIAVGFAMSAYFFLRR